MTRTEAPLCWFVDHEMWTLDANSVAVWMAVYGANVAYDCHASEFGLHDRLHWLTKGEIETAVGILVERQLLEVSTDDESTIYEAIEPTMLLERD